MFASDYRRIAREKLTGCWGISIGVTFLAALLGGAAAGSSVIVNLRLDEEVMRSLPPAVVLFLARLAAFYSILGLVQFILGGPILLGHCKFLMNQQDGRELRVNDLFSQFHRFGDGFVVRLLVGLYTFLWSLLFVIPGIVAAFRYAMAPYILYEHPEMRASEAIRASKELMKGHKWQLFCLQFSFIGWSILCLFTLGIGSLWLNPYVEAANAAFYREISAVK